MDASLNKLKQLEDDLGAHWQFDGCGEARILWWMLHHGDMPVTIGNGVMPVAIGNGVGASRSSLKPGPGTRL